MLDERPRKFRPPTRVPVGNTPFAMSSYHTGIINVAFGDGSVHAISGTTCLRQSSHLIGLPMTRSCRSTSMLAGSLDGDLVINCGLSVSKFDEVYNLA